MIKKDSRFNGGKIRRPLQVSNNPDAIKSGDYPIQIKSGVTASGTSEGYVFDTENDLLITEGDKLFNFKSAGTNVFNIFKDSGNGKTLRAAVNRGDFGIGGIPNIITGNSWVFGQAHTASASNGFTVGQNNTISASYSIAMGYGNTSSANGNVAMGLSNHVGTFLYNTGIGFSNTITGFGSVGLGVSNTIGTGFSSAWGMGASNNITGANGIGIGTSNNDGGSTANIMIGGTNSASGTAQNGVLIGSTNSITVGLNSVAIGQNNAISNQQVVSIGLGNIVSGAGGILLGGGSTIAAASGVSLGYENTINASGISSLITGWACESAGQYNATVGVGWDAGAGGRLLNNIDGALMFGMWSNLPAMTIIPKDSAGGVGTIGQIGFGTTTPKSQVEFGGSMAQKVVTITTATYTIDEEVIILADATSNSQTFTLPVASTCPNRVYTIKRIDSSANTVTIDGNGTETIDGDLTRPLSTFEAIKIVSDGSNWWII